MVSATEACSEHPFAKAISIHGQETLRDAGLSHSDCTIDSFESVTGAGVKAIVSFSNRFGSAEEVRRVYL